MAAYRLRWRGGDGARPSRGQMQRQAFPPALLGPGRATLLEPPQPLRPQPPLLSINRPRHAPPLLACTRHLPLSHASYQPRLEWWRGTVTLLSPNLTKSL
jgi:hypothetical protein